MAFVKGESFLMKFYFLCYKLPQFYPEKTACFFCLFLSFYFSKYLRISTIFCIFAPELAMVPFITLNLFTYGTKFTF